MSREPDPDTALALVHEGWDQLRLQRPLAAWGSWQRAVQADPAHPAAREALSLLEATPELPEAARAPYRFRQPETDARRSLWDAELQGRDLEDLAEAASAFARLGEADPVDGAAPFNQGLCLAWSGRNPEAIAALDTAIARDAVRAETFEVAVKAAALAEVLRHGAGAEAFADDLTHTLILAWPDELGDPAVAIPARCGGVFRPLPAPAAPTPGAAPRLVFEWLDRPLPEPADDLPLSAVPWVRAGVVVQGPTVRLASPRLGSLWAAERDLHLMLGDAFRALDRRTSPLPLALLDSAAWQFRLPPGLAPETRHRLLREAIEHWHENELLVIPRQSLVGRTPADGRRFPRFRSALPGEPIGSDPSPQTSAALGQPVTWSPDQAAWASTRWDDPVARAKLLGLLRLREQLSLRPQAVALYAGYPFDRLRLRLGLEVRDPAIVDEADPATMSVATLAGLDLATLDRAMLPEVYRSAAWACDAETLGAMTLALVARDPAQAARLDVPTLFDAAVDTTLAELGPAEALTLVDRLLAAVPDDAPASVRTRFRIRRAALLDLTDDPTAVAESVALVEGLTDIDPLLADAIVALEDRLPPAALRRSLERLERGGRERGLRGQAQFARAWLAELEAPGDEDD